MALKSILFFVLALGWLSGRSQSAPTDSVKKLNEVIIKGQGIIVHQLLRSTGAESFIGEQQIKNQAQQSLVGALNAVPSVRMEERSPGSYRLSLRGSLLRSPFGIRNVKIYVDDFPLTDAGGNTYLNLLDAATLHSITVFKGPQASIFGANTGGAVLINTSQDQYSVNEVGLTAGSYALFHQTAKTTQLFKNYNFSISEGYQQSDGYRANSALKRKYLQTSQQWKYNSKGLLQFFGCYSNLAYQTPGGLTEAQMLSDAKAARPATPTLPGAVTQQAGVYNETLFGGLSNTYQFNSNFQYVIALFGNHTDFKNPFITNYEKRKERTIGLRSFVNYHKERKADFKYDIYVGVEGASTKTAVQNYNNNKGIATDLLASDDLTARQSFGFAKLNFDIKSRLILELGTSLNLFGYSYQSFFPATGAKLRRSFDPQLMPKLAASYLLHSALSWRASVSKGYSPPTLAEVRASDNVINTNLQAEAGWNYESGFTYQNKKFMLDGAVFYFHLKNAIVRRLTPTDAEYFVNAGGTQQLGGELQASWIILQLPAEKFLSLLKMNSSYTYSNFKFDAFKNGALDYSGNNLTGIPEHALVNSLEMSFVKGFYLVLHHSYTAKIPLNDANTVYSRSNHLADIKLGIRNWDLGKLKVDVSIGINNVFDRLYSLGNDLNAANNRYFNPAAGRNGYGSIGVRF